MRLRSILKSLPQLSEVGKINKNRLLKYMGVAVLLSAKIGNASGRQWRRSYFGASSTADRGQLVYRGWFRKISAKIFKDISLSSHQLFVFSSGWSSGFQKRYNVAHRAISMQATKLPAQYIEKVSNFSAITIVVNPC